MPIGVPQARWLQRSFCLGAGILDAAQGLGVDWMAQVVPFQFSASVKVAFVLVTYHPTAVQADAVVHDTPFR